MATNSEIKVFIAAPAVSKVLWAAEIKEQPQSSQNDSLRNTNTSILTNSLKSKMIIALSCEISLLPLQKGLHPSSRKYTWESIQCLWASCRIFLCCWPSSRCLRGFISASYHLCWLRSAILKVTLLCWGYTWRIPSFLPCMRNGGYCYRFYLFAQVSAWSFSIKTS